MLHQHCNTYYRTFLLLSALLAGMSSCQVTKPLDEREYLLDKNIIKSDLPGVRENLAGILKQKPNRKILGLFRFHLGVYNMGNRGKESRFKNWLKNTVGEPPVILDNGLTRKSNQQMEVYMQNSGYFDAHVEDTTILRKKKARVIYTVTSGEPYRIRRLSYEVSDSAVRQITFSDTSVTLIRPGVIFSNNLLQKERDRLSAHLRNHGYFLFNPLYITYEADSGVGNHQIDLLMRISAPYRSPKDTASKTDTVKQHEVFYFRDIDIELDYDPIRSLDSTVRKTEIRNGMRFQSVAEPSALFHLEHISEHIFLQPGYLFKQEDVDLTYRRLSDLGIFRFVNIRTEPVLNGDVSGRQPLRTSILLAPQPKQEYQIELEGTNSSGNFGIAGNFVYKNKNIFKGAETFTFKIKGGLEIQQNFGDTTYESTRQLALFNAYEVGPEVSLSFPRALWPFNLLGPSERVNNPATSITAAFNTQNRPEYFRQLAIVSYYFTKKTSRFNRLYFYPAELNYLNVELDPAFEKQLSELRDPSIILGYRDQFIANGKVSYFFNNQELNKARRPYFFIRLTLEFAGNTMYLFNRLNGGRPDPDNPGKLFNVPFAQYVRPDFDIRYYKPMAQQNSLLVFRVASGAGFTYGNSKQLPFEKSYYAGGPNDIRAWRTRQIGPGSNRKDDYFERFGDFKITGNLEYRFDVLRKLKGALFVDAGNIWTLNSGPNEGDTDLRYDRFYKQIAVATGVGIRFDFTFFILRMDGGIRMLDPALPVGSRWVFTDNRFSDITYNFGIGYPF